MKKILKISLIILVSLVLLYAIFIFEESIRLHNGKGSPLIKLGGTCTGDKTEHIDDYTEDCIGLGYRIKREYILGGMVKENNDKFYLISEEFWLFDKYLLRGWIS